MGGEHERQRKEPDVDLEQLLDEIGRNIAASPASPGIRHEAAPPVTSRQSALDFGGMDGADVDESGGQPPVFNDDNTIGEERMSRNVLMAGGALVALSLLCGVLGLFVAFGASGRIGALEQSVDALQSKLATLQVSGDPRVGQLQAEQSGLTSRLDELAQQVEAAASASPAKGDDAQLAAVLKRLDALERKVPQQAKSAPATPAKSPSSKPAASNGDWAVILVSFSTSAQAEGERARLQKLGLRAELFKSAVDGKYWYRVRVPGYASQESAKAAIPALEAKSGITGAWVAHR